MREVPRASLRTTLVEVLMSGLIACEFGYRYDSGSLLCFSLSLSPEEHGVGRMGGRAVFGGLRGIG